MLQKLRESSFPLLCQAYRMDEDAQGIEAKGGELRQSCAEAEREGREDFEAKRGAKRQ